MYLPQSFINRMADLNRGGKPSNPFAANFQGFQGFQQNQPAQSRRATKQRTAQPETQRRQQ
jgi:hypothetical protein